MSDQPTDTTDIDELADALYWALDSFDLTITPRTHEDDTDGPDWETLTALAARILGKDE